jgi:hypothetical protein
MLSHSLSTVNTVMSVPEGFKFKNQFGFDMSTDIMPDPAFGKIMVSNLPLFIPSMCMELTTNVHIPSRPVPYPALFRSVLFLVRHFVFVWVGVSSGARGSLRRGIFFLIVEHVTARSPGPSTGDTFLGRDKPSVRDLCMCAHRAECFSWSKVLSRKYMTDWKAAAGILI